jgi:hypothetical protein
LSTIPRSQDARYCNGSTKRQYLSNSLLLSLKLSGCFERQTHGKTHPYLFSQCQPIYARGLLPCQGKFHCSVCGGLNQTTYDIFRYPVRQSCQSLLLSIASRLVTESFGRHMKPRSRPSFLHSCLLFECLRLRKGPHMMGGLLGRMKSPTFTVRYVVLSDIY